MLCRGVGRGSTSCEMNVRELIYQLTKENTNNPPQQKKLGWRGRKREEEGKRVAGEKWWHGVTTK